MRLTDGAAVFAATLLAARPAAAHAFLRRYDLPLPLWHYLAAAGLAVALTFAVVALFARGGGKGSAVRNVDLTGTRLGRPADSASLRRSCAALSVALFCFLLAAGLVGVQEDPFRNILPATVWVIWWVGLAFIAALIGNVWPRLDPWSAIMRFAGWFADTTPARDRGVPSCGAWPAIILFLGFAWAELVWPDNARPASLAIAILVYSAATWAGMVRYGVDNWLRRGEIFSLIFGLFGRFAPLGRDAGGRLVLRPYAAGLLDGKGVSTSMTVFVVCLLATVSFDGFLHTDAWRRLFGAAFDASNDARLIAALGNEGARTLIMTAGLLAAPPVFLAVYGAVCAVVSLAVGRRVSAGGIARRFAPTLVPIAIAYHLAHYLSLLLIEGQRLFALVSDPFGAGWDLFGTAGRQPDLDIVDARFLWLFAVFAVVAGHAAAVWLAHATALRLFGDRRTAIVSQLPMLVLMVGYTMLSLWILAQPIVEV